jgi:CRISPR-associated protein Cmr6
MNCGWLFYKGYYKGIEEELLDHAIDPAQGLKQSETGIKRNNDAILSWKPGTELALLEQNISKLQNTCTLRFKTAYPGLVAGTGYDHEAGIEGEFKLGFSFDFTTGVPVIPGSSVKGILRSVFKHEEYIKSILEENKASEDINIETIEKEIFEGIVDGKYIPVCERIGFFDAVFLPEKNRPVFAEDYLTPHNASLFSEPVPLKFLRIRPGITICFTFRIPEKNSLLPPKETVLLLFRRIISDIGAGAKTAYGYGRLVPCNNKDERR